MAGSGRPSSAQFVLGAVLVQQFDVRERKVAMLAFTFALPLAVHVDFGHLHHVAHLWEGGGGHGSTRHSDVRQTSGPLMETNNYTAVQMTPELDRGDGGRVE